MFTDSRDVGLDAIKFVDLLRGMGVTTVSPCEDVQPAIMDAVAEAVRGGFFSISMLGHLNDGLRTAVLEYLNGEPSQGYNVDRIHPRARVVVANVSRDPFDYTASARLVRAQQSGNVIAHSSETRKPYSAFYERDFATIEPGDTAIMGAGLAASHLSKSALPYWDKNRLRQPRAPKVVDRLREVGGALTVYDGGAEEQLTWGGKAEPKPAPKKAEAKPKPAPKKAGKKKDD